MARNKLTATQIKAATKPGRLGDGDGLYLVTRKDGRKSWSFLFIRGGVRREMGLGPFGSGTGQVSLADARVKAEEIRTILGRSGDPFAETEERKAKKQSRTFQQAAEAFLKNLEGKWKNEKHRAQWEMTLGEAYCKHLLKINVAAISTDDIVAVLEPHWKEKNETASRLRGRIERILDYARVAGWRNGENPAKWKGHLEHLLTKPDEKMKRGNHAAMAFTEMPSFMTELGALGGISARALEFLILTAARTSEVLLATWDEVDLTNAVWTVPAERMKAGREHRVPLTKQAIQILTGMQSTRLNDFVFPGMKKDSPLSNMSMQKCLRVLEKDQVATVHGFRSAFRDWAGDRTTFQREVMEAALAHSVGDKAEQAYRRSDALEKRRKLMDAWSNYIYSTQNSKVIPLTIRK